MVYKPYTQAKIIITGAASGIGKELVRQLQESKPDILAVDFNADNLWQLREEFPEIETLLVDLSEKSGNQKIMDWVKANWERVDFCFANAGIAEFGPNKEQNWKDMDRLFQLNVHSPIQLGYMLDEAFPTHPFRHVITASAMAYWPIPGYSLYGATKSALLQWAKTVWVEKTGDWLSMVFPIATKTTFFETAGKDVPQAWPRQTAAWVATETLRGAAKGKKKIYPSKLFYFMLIITRFLRFLKRIVAMMEYRRYKKWLDKQSES